MENTTLSISEALKQGYTHIMMKRLGSCEDDEFAIHELTPGNLVYFIRRCGEKEFDEEEGLREYEHDSDYNQYFGKSVFLCSKPQVHKMTPQELSDKIIDHAECNDELVPYIVQVMANDIYEDADFIEGTRLINLAMAKYKSYTDTDIMVIPDSEPQLTGAIATEPQWNLNL